jgi:putative PIN family toxin of toxin-antitoxin system
LISKNLDKLDSLIENNKIRLLFSNELVEEFISVSKRPMFKKYFSEKDVASLLETMSSIGKLIEVKSNIQDCRDFKDNFLLNLAIDGKADYLVTGDNDLLVLKKIKKVQIITIKELFAIIE